MKNDARAADKTMPRYDAYDKVTGRARFSADYYFEGMLYACALWSPAPGALIRKIDCGRAESAPGVVRVITRKDIKGPNIGGKVSSFYFDRPVLVGEGEVARNVCDTIALIVAETEEQAKRARKLIQIQYEEIPVVHTLAEAEAQGQNPGCSFEEKHGDVDEVFKKAHLVVSQDYFLPSVEHVYLETESGCAYTDEMGVIHITAGTQDTLLQHHITCNALGLPYNKVQLHLPYIGGAFGGKHSMAVHAHLALIEQVVGRPVQLVWSREESISFSCKKQQVYITHSLAFDKDGFILGMRSRIKGECSPYLEKTNGRMTNLRKSIFGVYQYPAVDLYACMYQTTAPEVGAYRGVAHPDGIYVIETLMEKAAGRLGIDSLELRKKNWVHDEVGFLKQYSDSKNKVASPKWLLERVVNEAFEKAGPAPVSKGKKLRGRGMSCCAAYYGMAQIDTQRGYVADVMVQLDGSVTVDSAVPEVGQGITSVMRNLISNELSVLPEKIQINGYTGKSMPFGVSLGGSQGTGAVAMPLVTEMKKLRQKMEKTAKAYLGLPEGEELIFQNDGFYNSAGERVLDWREFAAFCEKRGVLLKASVVADATHPDISGRKPITPVCCVADVEVNATTGETRIMQLVTTHDIGTVIQREAAEGQIYGSTVMCVGQALMEQFKMKDGRPLTNSMATYPVPTAMDIPQKNIVHFIEGNGDSYTGWGAKGLGEHGMYNTAAAIANAISSAIGHTIVSLPITPEKILKTLGAIE